MSKGKQGMYLVVAMLRAGEPNSHSYYATSKEVDILLARGQATRALDGTKRVYLQHTRPRGSNREWRKVTNRTKNGAALFCSMQLVPATGRAR